MSECSQAAARRAGDSSSRSDGSPGNVRREVWHVSGRDIAVICSGWPGALTRLLGAIRVPAVERVRSAVAGEPGARTGGSGRPAAAPRGPLRLERDTRNSEHDIDWSPGNQPVRCGPDEPGPPAPGRLAARSGRATPPRSHPRRGGGPPSSSTRHRPAPSEPLSTAGGGAVELRGQPTPQLTDIIRPLRFGR